jgi:competence protein ComFC
MPHIPILDFLFPKFSLEGTEGDWVTPAEMDAFKTSPRAFEKEELTKRGIQSLDRVFAMSSYQDSPLLQKAIRTFKYRRIPGVGDALKACLAELIRKEHPLDPNGCLAPVPLYFLRRFKRGFNQAEMLAWYITAVTHVPTKKILKRIRNTGHQSRRTREERWKALTGAFRVARKRKLPSTVYLVDDVFTTGATLEECAKTLKAAGVERVEGIVLAYD